MNNAPKRFKFPAAALPALVLLTILACAALALTTGQKPGRDVATVPERMVRIPLPIFGAGGFSSADLSGRVSALNLFASWCLPCEAEHPAVVKLAERIPVYGLNYNDNAESRDRFLNRLGNPYAALGDDPDGAIAVGLGASGVPATFIVDAKGTIRYRLEMPLTEEILQSEILPLIGALKAER